MTFWRMWTRWWRRPSKHLLHRTLPRQVFITYSHCQLFPYYSFLLHACESTSNLFSFVSPFFHSNFMCFCSSVWRNSGFSGGLSQTGANSFPHSKASGAASNTRTCGKVSHSQIPTVCFDLGNEWDDFDDENLLRASEASLTSGPANAGPWHCEEKKISGRGTFVTSLHQTGCILFKSLFSYKLQVSPLQHQCSSITHKSKLVEPPPVDHWGKENHFCTFCPSGSNAQSHISTALACFTLWQLLGSNVGFLQNLGVSTSSAVALFICSLC